MNSSLSLPVLAIVTPLLFAVLCPIIGVRRERNCFYAALTGSIITAVIAWSLAAFSSASTIITYNLGGWVPPWGIQLRIDLAGIAAVCLIATAMVLLVVYSHEQELEISAPGHLSSLYTLMMLVEAGTIGFVISNDLFNIFLFMEIFFFAACGLTTLTREGPALKASFRYLLWGALSSASFLLGIIFLYSVTGTLDMRKISLKLAALNPDYVPVAAVALFLLLLALAIQSAVFPFHPGAQRAALQSTKIVRALLCSLVILVPVFGILRILGNVYGKLLTDPDTLWRTAQWVIAWTGAVSLAFFSIKAVLQKELSEIAVSSALSQAGLIVLSAGLSLHRIPVNVTYSLTAAFCGGGCLLLTAGVFETSYTGLRITELRAAGRKMPLAAIAFTLGSLTVIGIPFTAGYTAKRSVIYTCLNSGQWWFATIVIFVSLIQAYYCLRITYMLFAKPKGGEAPFSKAPHFMPIPGLLVSIASSAIWAVSYTLTPALLASFSTIVR